MSKPDPRSDPFGLGMRAFAEGRSRTACPFAPGYFEGRRWLLGWDFGRSSAAARQFTIPGA